MKRAAARLMHPARAHYLLRDKFTTPVAAPIPSPRSCEPTGKIYPVNLATGANPAISGGKYVQARPTSGAAWNAEGWPSDPITRVPGLMAYALFSSSTQSGYAPVAFATAQALPATAPSLGVQLFNNTTGLSINGVTVTPAGVIPANTALQLGVIARGNGYLYLIQGGAAFPNWTLLWVDAVGIDPILYAISQGFNSQLSVEEYGVIQKTGALARDFGKCAFYTPIPTVGESYVGVADGLEYISWNPGAGETFSHYFRHSDDNNTYRLDCNQAAGTIKLFRRVAGVDTELAAGKTQAWTPGTSVRVSVVHAGGWIGTFTQIRGGSFVAKHVAPSETFNLAATGVKVAGAAAISDLELWPRVFAGTDQESLA